MFTWRAMLLALCLAVSALAEDSEITKFMKHLEVIPDMLTEGPENFLKVTFDTGVMADKGVELTPTQVKNRPNKIECSQAKKDAYYTLIMADLDAPSRTEPKQREWLHFLVVNIPGNNLSSGGEVLAQYVGAGPPKDTGLHRYVFLLYEQPQRLEFSRKVLVNTSTEGRQKFSTKSFADEYKLGTPMAGNFFQAQYDNYVPTLYEQLGV